MKKILFLISIILLSSNCTKDPIPIQEDFIGYWNDQDSWTIEIDDNLDIIFCWCNHTNYSNYDLEITDVKVDNLSIYFWFTVNVNDSKLIVYQFRVQLIEPDIMMVKVYQEFTWKTYYLTKINR